MVVVLVGVIVKHPMDIERILGAGAPSVFFGLGFVAGDAEDPQVADVIGATFRDRDEVVALPVTGLEDHATSLTFAMSSLEPVTSIAGICWILVVAAVRVALISDHLIELGLVLRAVVGLRWPTTNQTRARSS